MKTVDNPHVLKVNDHNLDGIYWKKGRKKGLTPVHKFDVKRRSSPPAVTANGSRGEMAHRPTAAPRKTFRFLKGDFPRSRGWT